ncbi:MAG: hypothetical protein RLY71_2010 [Pseudomonadota bacterium]|jgi:uncharacterized protein (UPF0303 family)
MNIPRQDIELLAEQERRLVLPAIDADLPWQLGQRLRELALARGAAVTIEIRINRETVFFHAMPGVTPANADWARRKRNTVELLQQSSYRVGLELKRDASSLEAKMGLPTRDYASHGGSFPLQLVGIGTIGTVTVSGLPQREDHAMVVEALEPFCGLAEGSLALD